MVHYENISMNNIATWQSSLPMQTACLLADLGKIQACPALMMTHPTGHIQDTPILCTQEKGVVT